MVSSISNFQAPRTNVHKDDENKWTDNQKKRASISKGKLKINIKGKDGKDNSRYNHCGKLSLDMHQRSNQCQMPDLEKLLVENNQDSNAATERHTSSLIENFDQSDYIKNVIMQSRKVGGSRFGSPGQAVQNKLEKQRQQRREDKSFIYDMKKHGILKAFNDINKFSEFFQSTPTNGQGTFDGDASMFKH